MFGQLARLAAADASVFPSWGGRFSFSQDECRRIARGTQVNMGHIRPIYCAPGGGMTLQQVPEMLAVYGRDVIFLVGGGLHRFSPDLVDVFRQPEECVEISRQAVQIGAITLWLQLRIVNLEAARIAEEAGLNMITDRCLKIEHGRYSGFLHWVGINSEIISVRRGQRYF